jgi:methyltransferase
MVTRIVFTAIVAAVAAQRLTEVARSRRHTRALLARGAREHARWQTPMLAAVHTAWLVSTVVEVWLAAATPHVIVAAIATTAFAAGQLLRRAAMRALGPRWTIGIVTLPDAPTVRTGVYRYLRHPNYLGVMLEIAALPAALGAYRTAIVSSIVNALALAARVVAEERALARS